MVGAVVVRRGGVGGRVDVLLGRAAPRRGLAAAAAAAGEGGRRRRGGVASVPREEGPHGWARGGRGRRERGGEWGERRWGGEEGI